MKDLIITLWGLAGMFYVGYKLGRVNIKQTLLKHPEQLELRIIYNDSIPTDTVIYFNGEPLQSI